MKDRILKKKTILILTLFLTILFNMEFAMADNKILKFSARWCPPCQQLKPILAAASEKTGVPVTEIDIDVDKTAPDKFRVRGIPTLIFQKDGVEVDRFVGTATEAELIEMINKSFGL